MSEPTLDLRTTSVADGVALLQLDRPEARNAINTEMLDELLAHLGEARADDEVRALVVSSTDHMGLSAGADVREQLEPEARCGGWSSSPRSTTSSPDFRSRRSPPATAPASAAGAEIAVCCDLRVGGANLRLRFPGGGARRPGRPRAPGHALRALGREVPAADREGGRRRRGLPLGPRAQGRAGGAHRGGRAAARRSGGRQPAGGGREAQADAARARRRRGPLARSEGEGQVDWAVARAPGLRLPRLNLSRDVSAATRLSSGNCSGRCSTSRSTTSASPHSPSRIGAGEAVDVRASGAIRAVPARRADRLR